MSHEGTATKSIMQAYADRGPKDATYARNADLFQEDTETFIRTKPLRAQDAEKLRAAMKYKEGWEMKSRRVMITLELETDEPERQLRKRGWLRDSWTPPGYTTALCQVQVNVIQPKPEKRKVRKP